MRPDEGRYHIPKEAAQPVEDRLRQASVAELEKAERLERQLSRAKTIEGQRVAEYPPEHMLEPAFDPRKEVSADALYIAGRIVKHLWIIFVLLPIICAVLYELLK